MGHPRAVWGGDKGAVVIEFDAENRVLHKNWHTDHETLLDKLRTHLGV